MELNQKRFFSLNGFLSVNDLWRIVVNIVKSQWRLFLFVFIGLISILQLASFSGGRISLVLNICVYPGFMWVVAVFLYPQDTQVPQNKPTGTVRYIVEKLEQQNHQKSETKEEEREINSEPVQIPSFASKEESPLITPPPSLPPPPPPPPPPPSNSLTSLRKRKLDCRRLSWEGLRKNSMASNTIWSEMIHRADIEHMFKTHDLEKEFGASSTKKCLLHAKEFSQGSGESLSQKNSRSIMDSKKIFNISIVLRQSKVGIEAISSLLMRGNNAISPDVLRQILLFLPDKNEIQSLRKQHMKDPEALDRVELFCFQIVSRIPAYREKLRTMCLKGELQERVDVLKQHLEIIILATEELKSSEKLRDYLEALLNLGNLMNGSDEKGFKIGFLTKMSFMKSTTDKKTAFFEFFTKGVVTTSSHLIHLADDLPHIHESTKVNFTHLEREIKELETQVKTLEEDVFTIQTHLTNEDNGFIYGIEEFADCARRELNKLLNMRDKARTAIIDTLQYFGEDSNKLLGTEEFFGVFSTFIKQFEDIVKNLK